MLLKYRDGTEADDMLFDLPKEGQNQYVARCLGFDPDTPKTWPFDTIERLLGLRRTQGEEAFFRDITRMLVPNAH